MSDQERIKEIEAQVQAENNVTPTNEPAEVEQGEPAETGEAQEAGEPPAETGEPVELSELEKAEHAFQKKLRKRTREKYQERRMRESLEAELLRARQELDQYRQPRQEAQQSLGDKTLHDFNYDMDEFQAYQAERVRNQVMGEIEAQQRQQQEVATVQAAQQRFQQQVQSLEANEPGAWDEISTAPVNVSEVMAQAIHASDKGAEIALYLARNLQQADSISQMAPFQQVMAIGRIEAGLAAPERKPPPPPRAVSKAPAPVPAIQSGARSGKDWTHMSTDEHIREFRERQGRV